MSSALCASTLRTFIDALLVAPPGEHLSFRSWCDARRSLLVGAALLGVACGGEIDSTSCTDGDCAGSTSGGHGDTGGYGVGGYGVIYGIFLGGSGGEGGSGNGAAAGDGGSGNGGAAGSGGSGNGGSGNVGATGDGGSGNVGAAGSGGSGDGGSGNGGATGDGGSGNVGAAGSGGSGDGGSGNVGAAGSGGFGSCDTCTGGFGLLYGYPLGGQGGTETRESDCFDGVSNDGDDLVDCDDPDCSDPCLSPDWNGCTADGRHACVELVGPSYFETRPDCSPDVCGDGPYLPCEPACHAPYSHEYPPGTPGNWSGCRGNGVSVCTELVTDLYFEHHPACTPNETCAGSFSTCNEICPAPVDDEIGGVIR
ncbi:MAG: hypothetical protein JW751_17940 [Polyangiaceae bacterium]|nr:hypothetical protein [Polyangiaceae bacterium]